MKPLRIWLRLAILILGIVALGLAFPHSMAQAAKFRRPFSASIGVNYGYDNYSGGGCRDFACGSVCYDGHSGTDFPLTVGTSLVAAASGRVSATNEGCADYGGLGNTCGGRCGNYVQIDHQDGTVTIFCHMKNGSVAVSVGQWVSCGQYVGQSASSGNSSGPHLHFGLRVGGVSRDPFAGNCSQSTSYWVGQGSYSHNIPSATCATTCACNAGQVQTEGCGSCGTRSRTCGSNCQWGSWSACTGQGVCSAGQVQQQACGDCGTRKRTCTSSCQWGGWSACTGQGVCSPGATDQEACGNCGTRSRTCASSCAWASWGTCLGQGECSPGGVDSRDCCDCGTQSRTCGNDCSWSAYSSCDGPDPEGGTQPCETDELGPCAAGAVRCIEGCLACRRTYDPVPETCDDVDNDCSGEVDDGEPSEMGDPLPEMAARLVDVGYPASLNPGARASGWVVFRNEGSRTWEAGDLWLEATSTWDGAPSSLHDDENWPAYGVVAVLDRTVPGGEEVMMDLPLKSPVAADGELREQFHLVDRKGWALRCPAVQFDVAVVTRKPVDLVDDGTPAHDAGEARTTDGSASAGCACAMSSRGAGASGWFWLVALGWVLRRRAHAKEQQSRGP